MLRTDKLREHKNNPVVVAVIGAALDHQTNVEPVKSLGEIERLIPELQALGIWTGSNSPEAAESLAIMLAGLEGHQAL